MVHPVLPTYLWDGAEHGGLPPLLLSHVTRFPSQRLSVLRSSSSLRCVIASLFDLRNVPVCVIGTFVLCLLTQINPSLQIERDGA